MVVQFSTGGRGRDHEQRKRPLSLVPEMASFATGSVNFTNWIYENPPKFIDELAELLMTQNIQTEIEIYAASPLYRSEERTVGNEVVMSCNSGWCPLE